MPNPLTYKRNYKGDWVAVMEMELEEAKFISDSIQIAYPRDGAGEDWRDIVVGFAKMEEAWQEQDAYHSGVAVGFDENGRPTLTVVPPEKSYLDDNS